LRDAYDEKERILRTLSKDIDCYFRELKQPFRAYRAGKQKNANKKCNKSIDETVLECTESRGSTFDRVLEYNEYFLQQEKLIDRTKKNINRLRATYDYL